ncbi:MAG TPA: hypothetical protein VGK59_00400 [Ohtaekwangia sp.]
MGYVMFILAFIIGYPLFMATAYLLAKFIFVKIEDDEMEVVEKKQRVIMLNRQAHLKNRSRLSHTMRVRV